MLVGGSCVRIQDDAGMAGAKAVTATEGTAASASTTAGAGGDTRAAASGGRAALANGGGTGAGGAGGAGNSAQSGDEGAAGESSPPPDAGTSMECQPAQEDCDRNSNDCPCDERNDACGPNGCMPDQVCVMDACVECASDVNCSVESKQGRNRCALETNTCVACLDDLDCGGETPVCDLTANTCAGCVLDADCKNVRAPRCQANKCEACNANSQCTQFRPSTEVCDIEQGRCVACTATEGCGGNVCILSSRVCSTVPPRSLASCEECEADAQCQPGHLCVALDHEGVASGNRCVPVPASSGAACPRPFREASGLTSVDDVPTDGCVPPPLTTCQGVLDARNRKPCGTGAVVGSTACGQTNLNDGICLDSDAARTEWRCSYICDVPADCEGTMMCVNWRCQ